jgi:hypothetical protein
MAIKTNFITYAIALTKDKLIGNIIIEELIKKVHNPERLLKICKEYKINFEYLVNVY